MAVSQTATAGPAQYSFTISASQPWTDTGVDLSVGDTLTFTAEAKPGTNANCVPQGGPSNSSDTLPLSDAPAGALIAKLSESAGPLLVGSSRELRSDTAGHLFLALNQTAKSECAFAVKVTITHAQAAGQATAQSHNMKDQLSSAAKVWLTGQLGTSTSANNTPTSNAISENGNATVPASSSAPARLKIPTAILDSDLASTWTDCRAGCMTIWAIWATW